MINSLKDFCKRTPYLPMEGDDVSDLKVMLAILIAVSIILHLL